MTVKEIMKPISFDDDQYKRQVGEIRQAYTAGIDVALKAHDQGDIDIHEFERATGELRNNANTSIGAIIDKRKEVINEKLLSFDRELAGCDKSNPHHMRLFRDGLESLIEAGKKDKNQVIDDYNASLRLNDEMALRCAALAGLQLGIDEITTDFARRDPDFLQAAVEKQKFAARYTSFEGRLLDKLGDFRTVDLPKIIRSSVEAGRTGRGEPYYRVKLKKG